MHMHSMRASSQLKEEALCCCIGRRKSEFVATLALASAAVAAIHLFFN